MSLFFVYISDSTAHQSFAASIEGKSKCYVTAVNQSTTQMLWGIYKKFNGELLSELSYWILFIWMTAEKNSCGECYQSTFLKAVQ